jgi:hypothetical protein
MPCLELAHSPFKTVTDSQVEDEAENPLASNNNLIMHTAAL